MLAANDVASVLIARNGHWMDAWTLQKLLYYVQAWHAAVTDEPLFDDRTEAWKDGPVVPQVWRDRHARHTRRPTAQGQSIVLDDLASGLVDLVLRQYGSMSGAELRALTHEEKPWCDARGELGPDAHSHEEISPAAMAAFYRAERKLGGQTAADLAATGVHLRDWSNDEPLDIASLLAELPSDDDDFDLWGGANLSTAAYDDEDENADVRRTPSGR